jgi:hypothetical protein
LTETGTWKLGEQPAFVSLGAGGAYFMRTVGGGGAWELKGQAEGINTYLTNAPNFADIKVTLSHSTILLGQCPTALLQTFLSSLTLPSSLAIEQACPGS